MTDRKSRQEIQIDRNPIERFLMNSRDFIKNNKRPVFMGLAAVLLSAVITVSLFIYLENYSNRSLVKFELIIENYRQNPIDETVKNQTIADLEEIIDSTRFGFIPRTASYILGNIHFEDKRYDDAFKHLSYYVDKTSVKDALHPIALNKAAVALEETGKADRALAMLVKYEEKVKESLIMDQVLFNIGRLYSVTGDRLRAREYFDRVINTYPDSTYAERSKERLFLMSVKKG